MQAIVDRAFNASDLRSLTLAQTLASHARPIVWCKACAHQVEPDIAELVAHHGTTMTVIDWATYLRCPECGAREADFVVIGVRR